MEAESLEIYSEGIRKELSRIIVRDLLVPQKSLSEKKNLFDIV